MHAKRINPVVAVSASAVAKRIDRVVDAHDDPQVRRRHLLRFARGAVYFQDEEPTWTDSLQRDVDGRAKLICRGGFVAFLHQRLILELQRVTAFDEVRIDGNAVDRTYLPALRLIEMTDALRAFGRIDLVDLRPLRNGLVRAFGLAHIAVDAFVGDEECHVWKGPWSAVSPPP